LSYAADRQTDGIRSAKYKVSFCKRTTTELIISITRNQYCYTVVIVKKHDMLNVNSDSMFKMSTGCFLHAWSLLRNDGIAALIGP